MNLMTLSVKAKLAMIAIIGGAALICLSTTGVVGVSAAKGRAQAMHAHLESLTTLHDATEQFYALVIAEKNHMLNVDEHEQIGRAAAGAVERAVNGLERAGQSIHDDPTHEHEGPVQKVLDSQIRPWRAAPEITAAVHAQNDRHATLTQSKIDELAGQWRTETAASSRPLIDAVMGNSLSRYLQGVNEQGQGLYSEIIVMDSRGLNVGQSDLTSDYWQGDEAKWQRIFLASPSAVHIGKVEQDESSQMFQSQLSITLVDPDSGESIGALTVGINVQDLLQ